MKKRRLAIFLLTFAFLLTGGKNPFAQTKGEVKMEWLSWSHFRFTSPTGKVILTNPFLTNPDSKTKLEDIKKADIVLVADGHGDEVGQAPEISKQTGAKVVTPVELHPYLISRGAPEKQLIRFSQPGDLYTFDGITVRIVNSVHGSATPPPHPYGGPAVGFMITFENGLTVYFAGSTAITLDMQLWGSLYKPDVAIIILSGNRDPKDAAHMVRLLLTDNPNLKTVLPHHHRVKPPKGAASPEQMEAEIKKLGLPVTFLNPELGKVYTFTK